MLFSAKNKSVHAITLAIILAAISIALKSALGLDWSIYAAGGPGAGFTVGLAAILASDLLISALLILIFHARYVRLYMDMALSFSGQNFVTILFSGLLAASEELFFRGVLLQGAVQILELEPVFAVLASALAFGVFHIRRDRRLAIFSLWAVWEGIMLGAIYVYTGSILVTASVHAAHDIAGFGLFYLQRRRGFLLFKNHPGF